jgi:hypothetical protein
MPLVTPTGPCQWPDTLSFCCPDWDSYDTSIQTRSLNYAKTILWAGTGRQFGLCEMTVRPCGRMFTNSNNWPAGWYWDGYGTWTPYVWNGNWYNGCGCGGPGCCNCDPDCQVYLPGPVYSVSSVQVDGATLPITGSDGSYNYFVLDQQWLVRTDTTACWPNCGDQNVGPGSADAFEVVYLRGKPVPDALADAMATVACEYAKACVGAACRLPARVSSIARQGVTVSTVTLEELMRNGLTGLYEVDQLIMSYNPYGLKGRTRFYSPELKEGRQVTFP